MNITLYSGFSKRRNSTLRPGGGTGKSVVLKDNTSMMRPAFLLSSVDWSWNYASWGSRYYYITDIVQEANNLFRVECELDELATFKDQIGSYSTLISRSSADQDYDVIDTLYPAKGNPVTKMVSINNAGIFTSNISAGTIVMGTVGNTGQHFYMMDMARFRSICYWLFPALGMDFSQWALMNGSQMLAGGLNTILQNITVLKWLPIPYSVVSGLLTEQSEIHIGNWTMPHACGEMLGGSVTQVLGSTITFPARDDAGARGKWLYSAPFAYYSVYIPPFGKIELDGTYLVPAGRQLTIDIMAEMLGGNVTLRLYYALGNGAPKMVGVYNANVGYNMEAGGTSYNFGGVASAIAGAAVAYAEEKTAGVVGNIASALVAAVPGGSQIGGGVAGPAPDIAANWYGYATYFDPIEENRAELGRPLGEVATIGSLGGYVQTADAKLAIPGHEAEMVKVNEMLNGGIFYE